MSYILSKREQPLFSCKAHVFQLEPELKKSWIPLSSTAVNVQFFHNPLKNIYRIVSIEGTKVRNFFSFLLF